MVCICICHNTPMIPSIHVHETGCQHKQTMVSGT